MKKSAFLFINILAVTFGLSACSSVRTQDIPKHDETLVYPLAFDLTYLRTMEALESAPDWELASTNKEKGLIKINNTNFSSFDDADKREATFVIKRVNRSETSIALAPESQQVLGGDELLKRVAEHVSSEVK